VSKLGDITASKVDQTKLSGDGEFVYVDISSIDNQSKRIADPKSLPFASAPSRARQLLRKGDVLVSMTRPNLNAVAIVPPDLDGSIGSTGFHVLRANDGVEPHWIYYAVQSSGFVKAMCDLVQGALYPAVRPKDIREYSIDVPPLSEQRRIVAEIEKQFSRLDEAVANLQRVKANLKRYRASVLKAAVEGRLVETEASIAQREGRSYETGEQLLQRILEARKVLARSKRVEVNQTDPDDLPDCPEGWEWTTCDAAINSIDAGASFKCEERPPLSGEVGVLKVSALTWGTYDENESKTCKDDGRIEEKYVVRDGDFLFSRANTIELVGACVIVGKTTKKLMLSDKTLRFKIDKRVLPEWLQICLRSKFGRDEIERLATGNQESMRNIGQERIRQIRMPLPPLSEQKRIVAEVDRHLSIIREVLAEVGCNLQRAKALRQATLAKVFLGEQS
jgi:type I restriction enzyme S subunit